MLNIRNKQCISITINKNCVTLAARLKLNTGFQDSKVFNTSCIDLIENNDNEVWDWVVEKIQSIKGYKGIPVNVELPDPVLLYHLFSLNVYNKKNSHKFLLWKFCDLYHLDESRYALASSYFGVSNKKHNILTMVASSNLIAKIQDRFRANNIPLNCIDAAVTNRFNKIMQDIEPTICGTNIHFDSDYWSIMNWHDEAIFNDIRSKWYKVPGAEENRWSSVHAEFERMSRIYQEEHNKISSRVYLSGAAPDDYVSWLKDNTEFCIINLMGKDRALTTNCVADSQ